MRPTLFLFARFAGTMMLRRLGGKDMAMCCRGVRGATRVEENRAEAILGATKELLREMVKANGIQAQDIASAIFTMTPDLDAAFPARAAREVGWQHVPLLDAREIPVPGSIDRCIRVLLHWNTDVRQEEIKHLYMHGTHNLRPDLAPDRMAKTSDQLDPEGEGRKG